MLAASIAAAALGVGCSDGAATAPDDPATTQMSYQDLRWRERRMRNPTNDAATPATDAPATGDDAAGAPDSPASAPDAATTADAATATDPVAAPDVVTAPDPAAAPDVVTAPDPVTTPTPTPTPTPGGTVQAFPGAEGFGAGASGGRGGRVLFVTNLNASGPGSLQAALDTPGPRYILFRVSGLIPSPAHISYGDVTIAGQTSPGGVIVQGIDTTEDPYCDFDCGPSARGVQNIILRHLRSRPGNTAFPDGLRLRYSRNVIADHLSIANATDEAVEISFSHDVTVQNTTLSETIGEHYVRGGMLVNYSNPAAGYQLDRLSIHHNVWNRIGGRFPELSRESPAAARSMMQIEVSNNLFWDQSYYADVNNSIVSGDATATPVYYSLNWIGNQSYVRGSYAYGQLYLPLDTSSSAYLADNHMDRYPTRTDWGLMYCCNDFPVSLADPRPAFARAARLPFPAITYVPAASVRDYALANAGAFPRDPMDRRLMDWVRRGTIDPAAIDRNPYNDAWTTDFAPGAAPAAPVDTDNDGMPDAWETAHGLDPAVPDHNGTGLSVAMTGVAGYTNLECYLNELSAQRVAGR